MRGRSSDSALKVLPREQQPRRPTRHPRDHLGQISLDRLCFFLFANPHAVGRVRDDPPPLLLGPKLAVVGQIEPHEVFNARVLGALSGQPHRLRVDVTADNRRNIRVVDLRIRLVACALPQ